MNIVVLKELGIQISILYKLHKKNHMMFSIENSISFYRVDTSQDSAQNLLDFVPIVSNQLTFTVGGDVIQFVDITIRDDNFIEGPENFTATLTSLSSLAIIGPVSTTTITILDNDGT